MNRPERQHMYYLDRLIRMGLSVNTRKRANWLKFCHLCGTDISTTRRSQRRCENCKQIRREDR